MNHFIWVNLLSLRLIDTCASYVWLDLTLFVGWQNDPRFFSARLQDLALQECRCHVACPELHEPPLDMGPVKVPSLQTLQNGQVLHSPALHIRPPQAGLNIVVQHLQALQLD